MNRLPILLATLPFLLFLGVSRSLAQQSGDYARSVRPVNGMKLKVSPNNRYLVSQDGKPFFYLGDTAWTLFKRLKREEADEYLKNRVAKGFTVIQAYVLRGLEIKNVYGDLTLIDRDPTKLNEAFFKNVDYIVNKANDLGLAMGLVVTYGEHVRQTRSNEQVFNTSNAFAFGKILGSRYKDNCVIWLLGGDRGPEQDMEVWRAMGKGLKEGSQGTQLVSYHGHGPRPGFAGYSSSFWFHSEDWLDFNMIQSGHRWGVPNYEFITHDYDLRPIKPTIDMEARYENHPDGQNAARRMDAHQQREAAYWAMLAGAAGHGYGNNNIWQFYDEQRMPAPNDQSFPFAALRGTMHWRKALDFEGAYDMGVMRKLFELRPWYRMVPDQSVIAMGQGEGENRIQAARAEDGSFLIAYSTFGNRIGVHMDKLSGTKIKAYWYDPREGTWTSIGQYSNTGVREFVPPSSGDHNDWVLVLEDMGRSYPVEAPKG
jgi:Protein of unknown function (DUF4038)/Putative collagen-binding domain of a collagenase